MKHGYSEDKPRLQARLSRIEGQVRGVSRMVDEDAYCIDILTQVNAIKAAMDQVALMLLTDHVKGCIVEAVRADARTEKVDELIGAVARFARA
jgi:DNA-binding FrmR family transcriptional regulator